jgi:hypothetical protein
MGKQIIADNLTLGTQLGQIAQKLSKENIKPWLDKADIRRRCLLGHRHWIANRNRKIGGSFCRSARCRSSEDARHSGDPAIGAAQASSPTLVTCQSSLRRFPNRFAAFVTTHLGHLRPKTREPRRFPSLGQTGVRHTAHTGELNPHSSLSVHVHQSELMIGAPASPVSLHFSIHLRAAGKSLKLAWDISKWSTTPACVS